MGFGVDAKPPGGLEELCDDAPKLCLESACFRGSELGRDDEGLQALQRLTDDLQAAFAVGSQSGARRAGLLLGSQQAEGVVQEGAAFGSASDTVGGQQGEGLRVLECVPLDCLEKLVLLAGREGTQRVRERRADPPSSERTLGKGRQPRCDVHSPCHPLRLTLQKARDGAGAHALLVSQGAHHSPLIQRGDGTRGRVGREQHTLVLLR